MGQLALGLRSLLVKAVIFVIMAARGILTDMPMCNRLSLMVSGQGDNTEDA